MIVIGIEDPVHHDAAGPAVIARLRQMPLPPVVLARSDGNALDLIEKWSGQDLAVIVDAVRTGHGRPGAVRRLSLHHPALAGRRTPGSDRLELDVAMELGRALHRVPRKLLLFTIEVPDSATGEAAGPAIGAAADQVAAEIAGLLAELAPADSHR